LRLQSSPDESLVVKLYSPPVSGGIGNAVNDHYNTYPTMGAGFTATGRPMEIEDRIGGVLHVVGQPGFPVILTSLHDDTVGAGLQPDGTPQTDSNNNGWQTTPSPGDWRSLRLDQFSHDRNVEIILEQESPTETAPGINASVATAQFLGDSGGFRDAGDENRRMGFEIHGFLSSPGDIDVYTFTAQAGTEIWLDIDRTTSRLDTVVELLDADGRLVASSNSSTWETIDPDLLYSDPLRIADTSINPLQKLAEQNQPRHASGLIKDFWTTNERDAGMRVLLPGAAGQRSPYTIRVRSSNLAALDPWDQLQDPDRSATV
jgi:large repetitive protein